MAFIVYQDGPWERIKTAGLVASAVLVLVGILFWGGFHWALEMTNTESFCITCHEMRDNVYTEYQDSVHYSNASGVRATCPDCHVPKEWFYKLRRKIQASNEVFHWAMGTVDTPEKFDANRLIMARRVWKAMQDTDSRECRNCHDFRSMDFTKQGPRGFDNHRRGFAAGKTCIDCHKGIAHRLPYGMTREEQALGGE
ncbi:periplasmic nitrate reductase subunit NapC [Magnetococcus marinus MC-1]|uniref:Cytochrome c-type protein n=1 Tax=Magnetococcus marinus (strain ATCC BAA-1437 / JCM 17883 / MC-1) TaxID=156889 RepID=A0L803_MAGMM|nr:NapC/NirT family cytochrome c [Magnetococcus marinus]ABK44096.1 periplasmic nitrate reductase subunit NapC [Magnetococcus marinus MC-1]